MPYFGYARADRKTQGRESIAAKLTANLLTEAGAMPMLTKRITLSNASRAQSLPVGFRSALWATKAALTITILPALAQ